MRRDNRRKIKSIKWWENKKIIMSTSVISMVLALIIGVMVYSNDSKDSDFYDITNSNQIISLAPENEIENNTATASTSVGKTVEETEIENNNSVAQEKQLNEVSNNTKAEDKESKKNISTKKETNVSKKTNSKQTNATTVENKKLEFTWPVKGVILKVFSVDNLLYSSTLQEWTVHNGIDIKADKSSVVVAAEDGTIKAIKNDPRYGLTVIMEHADGYKTIYSNLLTAEFVVEGEKVSKGQTIGTVGNSANFEVADETHLHFEMQKDSEYVDPTIYIK